MSAKSSKQASKVTKNQAIFAGIIASTTVSKSRKTKRSAKQSKGSPSVQIGSRYSGVMMLPETILGQ